MDVEPLFWPFDWTKLSTLDRVLMGIPFLGAQDRACRHVRESLRRRNPACLDLWGSGIRREKAEVLSGRLMKEFGRPSAPFLPGDPFEILRWDRRACAVDDLKVPAVLAELGFSGEALRWTYAGVVDAWLSPS